MKSIISALLVCAFLHLANFAYATDQDYLIETSQDNNSIFIKFKLGSYQIRRTVEGEKIYSEIFLRGANLSDEKGLPALPKIKKDLAFPWPTSEIKMKVISQNYRSLGTEPVLPSRGPIMRNEDPFAKTLTEASVYSSQKVYPSGWAHLSDLAEMRDIKVANLQINPFRYDFAKNELLILDELHLEVSFSGDQENLNWQSSLQNLDSSFLKLYQTRFSNFPTELVKDLSRDPSRSIVKNGRILIIAHKSFENDLSEYVLWKKLRGFEVYEYYIDPVVTNWMAIKEFIQHMYNVYHISYVQLVGDAGLVPFHPGRSGNAWGNEADPMYALVAGNDSYPDIFVSRFSVNNSSELRKSIRKTIDYERNPTAGGEWYSKGVGIASNEGSWSGLIDYERLDILRNMLLGWHYNWIDNVYAPNDRPEMISAALNEGRGFINYIGHGWEQGWVSGNFQNEDIHALQNDGMWPFIVSVACVNGRFAYRGGESFAEAWMNAGTESSPRGASAIFASSTNQSWVPPTVGQKKISELLTKELENTIGGLFFNGSIAVLEDGSSTAKQTFETWHIFGDASMQVRTKAPEDIGLKSARISSIGNGRWLLHLQSNTALSSVSISMGDQVFGAGLTNFSGVAYVDFKSRLLRKGDKVRVLLTGFNKTPYEYIVRID